jgi:hypothetical protein
MDKAENRLANRSPNFIEFPSFFANLPSNARVRYNACLSEAALPLRPHSAFFGAAH